MLENHLRQLVEELKIEPLGPQDDQKQFYLPLSAALKITLKELDPGFWFFAHIIECPKERREDLFILLMKANFLGQGTGGSIIGLDADEKFLTLSLTIPYDMNYTMFKETIEDFANFVEYWRKEVNRHEEMSRELLG